MGQRTAPSHALRLAAVIALALAAPVFPDDSRRSEDAPPQVPGTMLERLRGRDGRKMWKHLSRQHPRPSLPVRIENEVQPRLEEEPLPPDTKVLPVDSDSPAAKPAVRDPKLITRPAIHDPTRDGRRETIAQLGAGAGNRRSGSRPAGAEAVDVDPALLRLRAGPDAGGPLPEPVPAPKPLSGLPAEATRRPAPGEVGCQECPEEVVLAGDGVHRSLLPGVRLRLGAGQPPLSPAVLPGCGAGAIRAHAAVLHPAGVLGGQVRRTDAVPAVPAFADSAVAVPVPAGLLPSRTVRALHVLTRSRSTPKPPPSKPGL